VDRGQPHRGPASERGSGHAVAPLDVVAVRPAVVVKIEPDQLDALVLEVDQRAVDPPTIGLQEVDAAGRAGQAIRVSPSPVAQ
jgi:hypothetical protein